VRFREDKPEDRERARATVRQWRDAHPDGSADEMLVDLGPDFHPDYGPVLRAFLWLSDLRDAHVTTGISIITGEDR
jgi:hypothetical protein